MGFIEEGLIKHLLLIQIPRQTDRQICKFSKTFELNVSFCNDWAESSEGCGKAAGMNFLGLTSHCYPIAVSMEAVRVLSGFGILA